MIKWMLLMSVLWFTSGVVSAVTVARFRAYRFSRKFHGEVTEALQVERDHV
jgi:hypothetical protein